MLMRLSITCVALVAAVPTPITHALTDTNATTVAKLSPGSTLLRKTPLLMTHDAGTGYVGELDPRSSLLKTQEFGFQTQLDCGTRAFDLRLIQREDGKAHFQHLPGEWALPDVGQLEQDLQTELDAVFKPWGDAHPDDIIVLAFASCYSSNSAFETIKIKACYSRETTGTDAAFFVDILRNAGVYVINDHPDVAYFLEHELTMDEAKTRARAAGQSGVVAIFQSDEQERIEMNYDSSITYSRWDEMSNYISTTIDKTHPVDKLWELQVFWQTVPLGTGKLHDKILNGEYPIFTAAAEGRLNLLEINWFCKRGIEIAQRLGAIISSDEASRCSSRCADAPFVVDLPFKMTQAQNATHT